MIHREYPITPSQQATNGALDIFVDGCQRNNVKQQLFGLSVLQSATAAQLEAAMPTALANRGVTRAQLDAMFSRE